MQRKVRNSMPLKETVFVPLASSQMPGATPPSSKYNFSRTGVKKKKWSGSKMERQPQQKKQSSLLSRNTRSKEGEVYENRSQNTKRNINFFVF